MFVQVRQNWVDRQACAASMRRLQDCEEDGEQIIDPTFLLFFFILVGGLTYKRLPPGQLCAAALVSDRSEMLTSMPEGQCAGRE